MLDPITRMSLRPAADDRMRAARLAARQPTGEHATVVLRLLREPRSGAVAETLARALLRA